MTTTVDPIKAKHRAMWALGDYDRVSTDVIAELGPTLVDAAGIRAGERVLDVAAGSGNASLPAAERGADVTAADLTPELIEVGRARAQERGLTLQWQEADAERLPFADDTFDAVLSCVGVMFAPFHQAVADELVRVARPGGRIALINWTPDGFIGRMFAAMKPFVAPAPPGSTPGPRWGDAQHVAALFGDRVRDADAQVRTLRVDAFDSPEAFRDFFARCYGPTIAAYRGLADDPARTAELDRVLVDLAAAHADDAGHMGWDYLLYTARVAGAADAT